ncbi:MAG: DNA polymerase IV [Chloroflexi bacterium]|nr:DNA polymerase IV [Chloroflexota bacterium]MCC6891502.1 DNA polymerase IV [Anaerolineae bacterium]
MAYRKILHLDLDAFFCAVEELHDPSLRGTAFAVGGKPDQRGVVSSCSYAARQFGVRSALPMSQAVRMCANLVIRPPNFKAYRAASEQVMTRLNNLTPFVEQISIDEAFMDVTMLPDNAETIARRLQAQINAELGLPCSLGVAANKLVAKIANNIGKERAGKDKPPNAILVIPPGQEAAFLAPLGTRELWGVGPKTAEQLAKFGIKTIGDIARYPENKLIRQFGKHGEELAQRSKGIDNRPVETEGEAKSVSKETTFSQDVRDAETLKRTLRGLADGVGRQLRKNELSGTTIKIKLRWSDFTTLTRQVTLNQPTQHDNEIYEAALDLFTKAWPKGRAVRLIGVGVSSFEGGAFQPTLWDAPRPPQDNRLESVLDALRDRFGEGVVKRGSDLLADENGD